MRHLALLPRQAPRRRPFSRRAAGPGAALARLNTLLSDSCSAASARWATFLPLPPRQGASMLSATGACGRAVRCADGQ